jgi:hypothetical protein
MRYRLTFIGRQVGALGVRYRDVKELEAADPEAAWLALYETHEHIERLDISVVGEGAGPERRVIEWTPGQWWVVEVSGRDGSYTPLYQGKGGVGPARKAGAQRWLCGEDGDGAPVDPRWRPRGTDMEGRMPY